MATPEEEKKKVEQSAGSAPPATPAAPVTPATPAVAEAPALEQKENDGEGVKADPAKAKPSDIMHKRVRVSDGNTNHDPVPQILSNGDILLPPERGKGVAQLRMQLDDNKVAPPPPAPAPEEKKEFAYSDLFEPEEETEEERKKREKLEKNRQLWAMLGDGISALANIAGTAFGARSVLDGSEGLSARTAALFEREKEARDKRFAGNKARNVALRQKLREEELAKYKAETERQNAETRAKLADSEVAKDESAIELAKVKAENMAIRNEYQADLMIAEINRKNRANIKVSKDSNAKTYTLEVAGQKIVCHSAQEYYATVEAYAKQMNIPTVEKLETSNGGTTEKRRSYGDLASDVKIGESSIGEDGRRKTYTAPVTVKSVDTLYQALKQKNPGMGMSLDQVRATCKNVQGIDSLLKTAISWGAVPAGTTREGLMKKMGLKLQTKNQAKPKQSAQPNKQQGKSQQGKQQSKGQQQGSSGVIKKGNSKKHVKALNL